MSDDRPLTAAELVAGLTDMLLHSCKVPCVRSMAIVIDWVPGQGDSPYLLGDKNGPLAPHKMETISGLLANSLQLVDTLLDLSKQGLHMRIGLAQRRHHAVATLLNDLTDLLAKSNTRVQHGTQETEVAAQIRQLLAAFYEQHPDVAAEAQLARPGTEPGGSPPAQRAQADPGGRQDPGSAAHGPENRG